MLKNFRVLAVALLSFVLVSGGPGASAASSNGKLPAVITISSQGGFVAPGFIKTQLPELVAYSDGVVLQNDAASFRYDILRMSKRMVKMSWLKQQAQLIAKLSKTPKGGWGSPGVADVPDTRIRINLGAAQVNVGIFALNFTNGDLTAAQVKARKALSKALNTLVAGVNKSKPSMLNPVNYEVWAGAAIIPSGGVGIANPAAVFCVSMGGTETTEDTPDGQAGYCNIGDQKFDEWAYYREQSVKLSPWPSSVKAPVGECTVVRASSFKAAFAFNNETGVWLLPSGQALNLTFRPVLVGEKACKR